MIVLSLKNADLAFGAEPLLESASLELAERERVALVGRNGAGKSSLLRVLAGEQALDAGRLERAPAVRVSSLPQAVPPGLEGPVERVVAAALEPAADAALADYGAGLDPAGDPERLVSETLSRLDLEPAQPFERLSGGQQRRVLLARALVGHPGVLLLDEPTNHLDLPTIEWLESLLRGYRGAVMFTTHDRRFLAALATRIVEIDRGTLTSWPGDYANYLRRRDERWAAEDRANERFDKRLAEEEIWIRQGIKARRTRNEGRVRRLQAMRKERAERRARAGTARISRQDAEASGRRVIEARDITLAFDGKPVVEGFSTLISRGDRIGLVGPNGSGKTTLLRALIGELEPAAGEVLLGARVQIAYADQHRAPLDENAAVQDCVADGNDHVSVNGEGGERRHVIGYLNDFMFTAEQARAPVGNLSGGERNRLLLARLFARPANLLVMDEPTNDLDIETLELLEALLADYPGTLLVASHDREFLDNVVTGIIAFEGPGEVHEYVGGFSDWVRQRRATPSASSAPAAPRPGSDGSKAASSGAASSGAASSGSRPAARKKLGYNETRELAALPERIEALEARVGAAQRALADPALYRENGDEVARHKADLEAAEAELEAAYERWSALEALAER